MMLHDKALAKGVFFCYYMYMNKEEKIALVKELYQKYIYEDAQGIKSDRNKIKLEFEERTGEELPLGTLKSYIAELNRQELLNTKPVEDAIRDGAKHSVYSEDSDGNITSQIRERLKEKLTFTNEQLLKLHGINPEENVIRNIVSNEWTMTNKDGEQFFNFQSKIVAAPKTEDGLSIEELFDMMQRPMKPIKIKQIGIGVRNLVIGLADLHFPMCEDRMSDLVSEIFETIENGYETIVVEQLGDLFESSQMKDTITLKGTVLPTVDMVLGVRQADQFITAIMDHSLKYAKNVNLEHACGNHSGNLEYMLVRDIKKYYKTIKENRVTVNLHNDYRVAYKLGNVGIMMSHGDTVPLKRLPGIFAKEYAVLWGSCESHEVHTGHKHNKFVEQEVDGVVMRQFPTPKVEKRQTHGEYEERGGYISRKMIQLIEYNEDNSKVIYEIG